MKVLRTITLVLTLVPTLHRAAEASTHVLHLNGDDWKIAMDPQNVGHREEWFHAVREDVKPIRVPWILESAFPDYDGVVWYYKSFHLRDNPHAKGRTLLRFWAVDFKAEVWLNGSHLGGHEGS